MEAIASFHDGQIEVPEGLPDSRKALAQVFLMGPIRIYRGGRRLEGGWRRKSLELLAYLAVHQEGAAKDQILEALWPDTDPTDSQQYFWRAASYLRCRLRGEADDRRILKQVDGLYRLDIEAVWVDVVAFENALALSNSSLGPEVLLRFACDVYKGEFCEGRYFNWASLVQEHLRSHFIEASRRLAALLEREGEPGAALLVLDEALDLDSYDEELVRHAMGLEVRLGRRDLAVRRFRRLRRLLIADLGVEPSRATVRELTRLTEAR